MSKVQMLRALANQRQAAAAEEILGLFERSIAGLRDACSSREDGDAQHRTTTLLPLRADVQQVIIGEQLPPEQQEWSPGVDPDPTRIKEEQEELWSRQEGEQPQGPVTSEGDAGRAQSSQLRHRQTEQQVKAEVEGEDGEESASGRKLRLLVKQRLTSAVEDISGLFETTLAEYEKEIEGLHQLLQDTVKLEVQINTTDVAHLLTRKQEVPPEKHEWRTGVDQEDPEPPQIKEEQEELWSSREGEQLQSPEGDDTNKFPFTAVPVKCEEDEETAQSSQIHHRQTDEQMETGADTEDCGGSEGAGNFGSATDLLQECDEETYSSVHDTENSDDSQELSQPQSGSVTLHHSEDTAGQKGCYPAEKPCGGKTAANTQNMAADAGGKAFSCSLCGKAFGEKSDLKRHVRFHTGEKPFSCIFCEKTFTEKADLKRHMRVHTGEKPFGCPICGKGFSEKTDLTRHIRVHTGEKPFSCSACGKIFSQNENLRRHERIHTGEKPFSCPLCTKKFTHRGALVVHMRIHTGEKPFGCSVCGKRYSETGNLKKHMRVHTGEKPFDCTVCGRRFNYQSQVKTHKCSAESSVTMAHHS
ncbi:zinc finger and SCAN domain-containing protein 22-like [Toxotes jaculatrix]|uniref:zinc finger and SCAN domain-containing protein 22-like n=1 Tax=Toxotes jaculatrix TaxID=941984 RepID=UPI001B3A931C|nr:zinc finger and SCAN domain-containing protein 22-like [Toxotes jaculatrix]